jgi:hypothetical protein
MTWSLGQATFKQNFEAGWTKYVKPGFTVPPQPVPPDVYWDPRKGGWYVYPTTKDDVQDKGWPTVDISGLFVVPSTTFDHITDQYLALSQADQPSACWDPRRAQWMSVKVRTGPGGASAKELALRQLLQQVDTVHGEGYLGWHATDQIENIIRNEM